MPHSTNTNGDAKTDQPHHGLEKVHPSTRELSRKVSEYL